MCAWARHCWLSRPHRQIWAAIALIPHQELIAWNLTLKLGFRCWSGLVAEKPDLAMASMHAMRVALLLLLVVPFCLAQEQVGRLDRVLGRSESD